MTHPFFARLDAQLRQVESELQNLQTSHAKSLQLKSRHAKLYDEWTHRSSIAEGIRSVYTGLESIMKAIADEIDMYEAPRTENWHEKLIDQMALRIDGIREAVLSPRTKELFHELRRFRHVLHHNYAQHLEVARVLENHERVRQAVQAFSQDYKRFSEALQTPQPKAPRARRPDV